MQTPVVIYIKFLLWLPVKAVIAIIETTVTTLASSSCVFRGLSIIDKPDLPPVLYEPPLNCLMITFFGVGVLKSLAYKKTPYS